MRKETLRKIKEKLEKQKKEIKKELQRFAKENKNIKGDWNTNFPKIDGGAGSQILEDAADQVEEYVNLLPIEHNLETRLKEIERALDKIKKGKYGKCEKCKKNISEKKLLVFPETKFCQKCQ